MNTEDSGANDPDTVEVCALIPFWRYAVGPASQSTPALPFYRMASAQAFFNKARCELPMCGVVLYRRSWWNGIEVVDEYIPGASP